MHVIGLTGSSFTVKAVFLHRTRWKFKRCETRDPSLEKNDNVVGNGEEVVVNDDYILGEEGDADGDDGDETDADTKRIRLAHPSSQVGFCPSSRMRLQPGQLCQTER